MARKAKAIEWRPTQTGAGLQRERAGCEIRWYVGDATFASTPATPTDTWRQVTVECAPSRVTLKAMVPLHCDTDPDALADRLAEALAEVAARFNAQPADAGECVARR